jgi:hypothetical protein
MILVFKTNVINKKSAAKLKPVLNNMESVSRWNFDLSDCDKILRIEACSDISPEIISILGENGYQCMELD